jgi:hypothetical protein
MLLRSFRQVIRFLSVVIRPLHIELTLKFKIQRKEHPIYAMLMLECLQKTLICRQRRKWER